MREGDSSIVIGVGIVGEGSHGTVQVRVRDGHPLHGVPRATLLHLHDLAVPRELVGDLPHPGHAGVGELDREITVSVGNNLNVRCWTKTWKLKKRAEV